MLRYFTNISILLSLVTWNLLIHHLVLHSVAIKHLCYFLQGKIHCLRIEEIYNKEVTNQHTAPDNVVLPADSSESNGISISAEKVCQRISKPYNNKYLRTE